MSSCRHRTRSAEQRWPALLNAEMHGVVDDLLRQRGAVDDHRVLAAGLGDQRHDRRSRARAPARSRCRDLGRSGERDAGDARDRRRARAPTISPAPGSKCERVGGNARLEQTADRVRGDERRLLGGLRDHGVARGERRGDLAA